MVTLSFTTYEFIQLILAVILIYVTGKNGINKK